MECLQKVQNYFFVSWLAERSSLKVMIGFVFIIQFILGRRLPKPLSSRLHKRWAIRDVLRNISD